MVCFTGIERRRTSAKGRFILWPDSVPNAGPRSRRALASASNAARKPRRPKRTRPSRLCRRARSLIPPSAGPSGPDRSGKPVSTLGFWALKLLYAIPVVGFFASLVLSIAPENKSLKHHALATLIWRIIILGFLVFGSIRLWNGIEANWDRVSDSFSEIFEGEEINSLDDLLDSLKNGLAGAGS